MSGRYMRLRPGRYTLSVPAGEGPAGVRRPHRDDVRVDVDGGRTEFSIRRDEDVYFWWRGPRRRPGVRLMGAERGTAIPRAKDGPWPTRDTG
jgi:hypothetical protein